MGGLCMMKGKKKKDVAWWILNGDRILFFDVKNRRLYLNSMEKEQK